MMKKNYCFMVLCYLAVSFTQPTVADNSSDEEKKQTPVYVEENEYPEEDFWFGPGFYYGVWFNDEADYWRWRNRHPDYPPNRAYYHPDRRIEYRPNSPAGIESRRPYGVRGRFRGGR